MYKTAHQFVYSLIIIIIIIKTSTLTSCTILNPALPTGGSGWIIKQQQTFVLMDGSDACPVPHVVAGITC